LLKKVLIAKTNKQTKPHKLGVDKTTREDWKKYRMILYSCYLPNILSYCINSCKMKPEIANHLIRGFIFDKDIGTISRDYR
jgi:hypothetical protein